MGATFTAQKIPSIKYLDIYIGFTAITFCKWEKVLPKNQAETPYTEAGRQINFERTKKKRINARFDELYSEKSARAISYGLLVLLVDAGKVLRLVCWNPFPLILIQASFFHHL